jgi:predicted nucleotidyltransferase
MPEQTTLLSILHARREAIAEAGRRFGARRILVFGSVARGEETSESDIDFLVDFPRGYDLFSQRLALAECLAEITGRPVDLVPEHELNRHLKSKVLAEAVDL